MSLAIGFIFAAALLNILSKLPAVISVIKKNRYNNQHPRKQFYTNDQLERCYNAHLNTMEAFPVFAAGMIVAMIANLDPNQICWCGSTFLIARLAYLGAYVAGFSYIRSFIWMIGWAASLAPLVLAWCH